VVVADLVSPSDIQWDVRVPGNRAEFPSDVELVVNLAAVHREPGHAPHEYFETNVSGANNVVRLCSELAARRLVFASSISVYGPTERAVTEADVIAPVTAYGRSKAEAEDIHRGWQASAPTERRLQIIRPAVVFGDGEDNNFSRLRHAIVNGRFVYPGRRDTLKASGYVRDFVPAIEHVDRHGAAVEAFNSAFPVVPTIEAVCVAMAKAAGVSRPRISIPTAPMKLAGSIAERVGVGNRIGLSRRRIEKLVASTNVVPARLMALGFEWRYDLETAIADWFAEQPMTGLRRSSV
jgi:nucleoside-diphosphate-sugar epimerase